MLPGIRFLLAAIVLSMSILIFGLGAAALLRAAHEEVANVPVRRVMAEPVFAQPAEPAAATLALLRVEPAAPEKAPDTPPLAVAEPAPEAVPVPKVEAERLAVLKVEETRPVETVRPETALAEPPAPPAAAAEPPAPAELKVVAAATPEPDADVKAPTFELIVPPAMEEPAPAAPAKVAALGHHAAKVDRPAETRKASSKPDRSEIRRKQRAERAKERRRLAARRARLAAKQTEAAGPLQQQADPFSQMQPMQPAATTTRRR
jgi:hypothetical protein